MKKHLPILLALSLLVVFGVCVAGFPGPSSTIASAAQQSAALPVTQQPAPGTPDFPKGRGFNKPADKLRLKGLTRNYAAVRFPSTAGPSDEDPKVYYVDKDTIAKILSQSGCIGIRIYPGYKNSVAPYKPRLVIVGVERGPSGRNKDMDATFLKSNLVPQQCTIIETDDKCPANCDGTAF